MWNLDKDGSRDFSAETRLLQKLDRILSGTGVTVRDDPDSMGVACINVGGKDIRINFNRVIEQLGMYSPGYDLGDFVRTIKGLNHHEMAHLFFTLVEMRVVPKELRKTLNLLSDCRDETLYAVKFPKATDYFRVANLNLIVKHSKYRVSDNKLGVMNYPLMYGKRMFIPLQVVKAFRVSFVEEYGIAITEDMERIIDEYVLSNDADEHVALVMELYKLLKEVMDNPLEDMVNPSNGYSTDRGTDEDGREEAQERAEELHERVKIIMEERDVADDEEPEDDEEDTDTDGSCSGSGDSEDEDDDEDEDSDDDGSEGGADCSKDEWDDADDDADTDDSGGGIGDSEDDDNTGDSGGSSDEDSDDGEDSDTDTDGDGGGTDGASATGDDHEEEDDYQKQMDDMMDTLKKVMEDEIDASNERLQDEIETDTKLLRRERLVAKTEGTVRGTTLTPTPEMVSNSNNLSRLLQRIRTGLESHYVDDQRTGRLNTRAIVDYRRGRSLKIFEKFQPDEIDATKLGVVIIIDDSGSMSTRRELAKQGAWIISEAVTKLDGNKSSIIVFGSDVALVKGWSGGTNWNYSDGGYTETHLGLEMAYREIQWLKQTGEINQFVVFILTDGQWCEDGSFKKAVVKADTLLSTMNQSGIETVEINFKHDNYHNSKHHLEILNMAEFPKVMAEVIRGISVSIRRNLSMTRSD